MNKIQTKQQAPKNGVPQRPFLSLLLKIDLRNVCDKILVAMFAEDATLIKSLHAKKLATKRRRQKRLRMVFVENNHCQCKKKLERWSLGLDQKSIAGKELFIITHASFMGS